MNYLFVVLHGSIEDNVTSIVRDILPEIIRRMADLPSEFRTFTEKGMSTMIKRLLALIDIPSI